MLFHRTRSVSVPLDLSDPSSILSQIGTVSISRPRSISFDSLSVSVPEFQQIDPVQYIVVDDIKIENTTQYRSQMELNTFYDELFESYPRTNDQFDIPPFEIELSTIQEISSTQEESQSELIIQIDESIQTENHSSKNYDSLYMALLSTSIISLPYFVSVVPYHILWSIPCIQLIYQICNRHK